MHTREATKAFLHSGVVQSQRAVEKHWLNIGGSSQARQQPDLEQHTSFSAMFADIERMRIVPFDFRSIGQLVVATVGSAARRRIFERRSRIGSGR
jgi:hypothetical protein